MVLLSSIQMAFKYWTIWHPTLYQPFEYWTSLVFRSPLLFFLKSYLNHALRWYRTGSRWRPLLLNERVVRLILRVGPGVEQPEGRGVVVEGADVADEGGGVNDGSGSLSQEVVAIGVRYLFLFEPTPLVNQVVVTIVAHLEQVQDKTGLNTDM